MNIITLSGWGQPYDALASIAPNALHAHYAHHVNVIDALADITMQAKDSDVIIGWSLGGQLAVRAIAAGMLTPKYLVLLATPFQFVATPEKPLGMKRDLFDKFRANVASNPARALHKAWELIYKGDDNAAYVRTQLEAQDRRHLLSIDWLRWLDMLDGFSFAETKLAHFPPTLIIHGEGDVVVDAAQEKTFADAIPHSKIMLFKDCGHAPHWHNSDAVIRAIQEHIQDDTHV